MRAKRYIFAGWATAVTAIAAGAMTLPAVASKTSDQRVETVMQRAALEFRNAAEVDHPAIASSQTVIRLASLYDPSVDPADNLARIEHDLGDVALNRAAQIKTSVREIKQLRCLAEALYYEARSESRSGQLAVAEVIKNRVASRHFPNSICSVVYQGSERRTGCQFTFTCDGSLDRQPRGRAWSRSLAVAKLSLTQPPRPMVPRSTHYHTTDISPVWSSNLDEIKTVGSHVFYRFPFRERRISVASIGVAPPS